MCVVVCESVGALVRSGGDLLSRVLGRSTISGCALNGRVRDGIGCFAQPMATRPDQGPRTGLGVVSLRRSKHQVCSKPRCLTLVVHDFSDRVAEGFIPVRHWIGSSLLDD